MGMAAGASSGSTAASHSRTPSSSMCRAASRNARDVWFSKTTLRCPPGSASSCAATPIPGWEAQSFRALVEKVVGAGPKAGGAEAHPSTANAHAVVAVRRTLRRLFSSSSLKARPVPSLLCRLFLAIDAGCST